MKKEWKQKKSRDNTQKKLVFKLNLQNEHFEVKNDVWVGIFQAK